MKIKLGGKVTQFGQGLAGGLHGIEGKVERLPIASGQKNVAGFLSLVSFLGKVLEGVKVAEGFAHLPSLHHEVGDVEPVAGESFAGNGLHLGDLVFVVGKDQVHPSRVKVETLTEMLHANGAALDMPSRPALTPR